jgi:hypothetical protein
MDMNKMREIDRGSLITASEIGDFVYCEKAWQLKRCGDEPRGEFLEEGVRFQREHGAGVSLASRLERVGKLLFLTALVLLFVLIIFTYLFGGAG